MYRLQLLPSQFLAVRTASLVGEMSPRGPQDVSEANATCNSKGERTESDGRRFLPQETDQMFDRHTSARHWRPCRRE